MGMYNSQELKDLLIDCREALEGWGAMEDGIPDFNVWTVAHKVNPFEVYKRINHVLCGLTGEQNCSFCSEYECHDNTTEKK